MFRCVTNGARAMALWVKRMDGSLVNLDYCRQIGVVEENKEGEKVRLLIDMDGKNIGWVLAKNVEAMFARPIVNSATAVK
jgi:hypothetical protein